VRIASYHSIANLTKWGCTSWNGRTGEARPVIQPGWRPVSVPCPSRGADVRAMQATCCEIEFFNGIGRKLSMDEEQQSAVPARPPSGWPACARMLSLLPWLSRGGLSAHLNTQSASFTCAAPRNCRPPNLTKGMWAVCVVVRLVPHICGTRLTWKARDCQENLYVRFVVILSYGWHICQP